MDGGSSYNYITIPGLQHISFNSDLTGYALGRTSDSRVYITKNGGTTWSQINATRAAWAPSPVIPDTGLMGNLYMIKDNMLGYSEDEGMSFLPIFDSMNELYTTSNFVYATAVSLLFFLFGLF